MALTANGTLIPTNVANALTVNGVDIKNVYVNGLLVWAQSLFNGIWSGSTRATATINASTHWTELSGSGSNYRVISAWGSNSSWLTANSSGLASGASIITMGLTKLQLDTTPNALRYSSYVNVAWSYGAWIPFDTTNKFGAGNSIPNNTGFNTSGGLIRAYEGVMSPSVYGAWVSLT